MRLNLRHHKCPREARVPHADPLGPISFALEPIAPRVASRIPRYTGSFALRIPIRLEGRGRVFHLVSTARPSFCEQAEPPPWTQSRF